MVSSIVVGAGCFWGVESLFLKLRGVLKVTSGYSGGEVLNPTYMDICTGNSGHAEVVKVEFDSNVISLREVLCYFFKLHDPTTLNSQGYDSGTQYRSVIYYTTNEEKEIANTLIEDINTTHFKGEIVTEITLAEKFYPAEDYHQDYYNKKYHGKNGPICHLFRDLDFE
jgi:peptide-methionine (S)-S-oxide reductase